MTSYASREDLYRYGLPRGLLANPAQSLGSVSSSTDVMTLDGHGFETGTPLLFRAEEGGSLPSPLVAGTTYYAIRLTDSTFQASATSGGAALNLTTDGQFVMVSTSLDSTIDAELERYSRLVDSYLPAHAVPLESPFPSVVVGIVAELAAASLLAIRGQASALVQGKAEQTRKELARLLKGVPLRDSRATAPTNLAIAASSSSGRGWATTDGTIP